MKPWRIREGACTERESRDSGEDERLRVREDEMKIEKEASNEDPRSHCAKPKKKT